MTTAVEKIRKALAGGVQLTSREIATILDLPLATVYASVSKMNKNNELDWRYGGSALQGQQPKLWRLRE